MILTYKRFVRHLQFNYFNVLIPAIHIFINLILNNKNHPLNKKKIRQ